MAPRFRILRFSPVFVLALSLVATVVASLLAYRLELIDERGRFERVAQSVEQSIEMRFRAYEDALYAAHALFSSQSKVTPSEFHDFVEAVRIQSRYPGILGLGYAHFVRTNEFDVEMQSIRKLGAPSFHVWPRGQRSAYVPVVYVEPMNWRNQRAIGFDMYSEQSRREAMNRARDKGLPAATTPVTLVQETEEDKQLGFLIYLPVYRRGAVISTVEQRRLALEGFVYASFRSGDLFRFVSAEIHPIRSQLEFAIFDKSSKSALNGPDKDRTLVFDSLNRYGGDDDAEVPKHRVETVLTAIGHQWTLVLESTPDFSKQTLVRWPLFLFVLGTIISFLIYALVALSSRWNIQLEGDLSERKKVAGELLRAREMAESANRSKSLFLANMSHEIRTPVGVIVGFADLAMDALNNPTELKSLLRTIQRNGRQLSNLIGDVLDLSKIEAEKLEVQIDKFSLPRLIEDVVESFRVRASEKGIALTWDKSHEIPECVRTDSVKLRQILANLVGNAIKFTDQGSVTIRPRLLSKPEPDEPIRLEIDIEDTGVGISEEGKSALFKTFSQADASSTRRFGGTGLGLVLSRKLARMLGGDVWLSSSSLGGGSRFTMSFDGGPFESPWSRRFEADSLGRATSSKLEAPINGLKVLLVEDSIDNQTLVSRYLEAAGARVEIASNGLEGVQRALNASFDVVLMDIQMPVLDGHQATRKLRQEGFSKPILALTAHAFREERELALNEGFTSYVTKPINRETLLREIRACVDGSKHGSLSMTHLDL